MKYCKYAYNYLYFDTYKGDVMLCPWMDPKCGVIGNIFENDIDTLWNSEAAQKLRDAHTQNCFKYCRPQGCPRLQNNDFYEITDEEEYKKLAQNHEYPTTINLAYDFICNQYCETCRPSVFIPPNGYAQKMDAIKEKIAPYLDKAEMITASGHGDPFASPYMMELLENLRPKNKDITIQLETNGVFCDKEHWKKIEHLKENNLKIIVTVNSYNKFTYNHVSRGGNYEKLMKNLDFISELRKKEFIKNLVVSTVIQDRTFRELPYFISHTLDTYCVDLVVLRPVYQWGTMSEKKFWFKDVLNPLHPYHQEYLEILQDPILKDKRVYNFGGNTVHPARDFEIVSNKCCCEQKPNQNIEQKAKKTENKIIRILKFLKALYN